MKIWIGILVAILSISFTGLGRADDTPPPKKEKPVRGQVVSVAADGTSVVVKTMGKNGGEVTVTTDAKTTVTIDGTDSKLSDLKADLYVAITPATGTATKIVATTKMPERKKKPAAT